MPGTCCLQSFRGCTALYASPTISKNAPASLEKLPRLVLKPFFLDTRLLPAFLETPTYRHSFCRPAAQLRNSDQVHQHGHQLRLPDVHNLVLHPPLMPLYTPCRHKPPAEGRRRAPLCLEHPQICPGQKEGDSTQASVTMSTGGLPRGKTQLVDRDPRPDVLGDRSVARLEQGRLIEI